MLLIAFLSKYLILKTWIKVQLDASAVDRDSLKLSVRFKAAFILFAGKRKHLNCLFQIKNKKKVC